MFYTDTHAHIHLEELSKNVDVVLKRAIESGVKRIITVGVDLSDSRDAVDIASTNAGIFTTVGIHPHYADDFDYRDLGYFEKLLENRKVIAVGEVGLDFYRNISDAKKQKEVFKVMLDMALGSGKPVVIHAREAAEDTIKCLDEVFSEKDHKVLFHCFSGEDILINWGLRRSNVMFSFAGNVTYPKAIKLHSALDKIPIDRLFIETDCPYLAPVPLRGKINEPAYIGNTADFVSKRKSINLEPFLDKLEDNFLKFFGNYPAFLGN